MILNLYKLFIVHVHFQIAEGLNSVLESDGRELDRTIILDETPKVFPYERLHNLVRRLFHYTATVVGLFFDLHLLYLGCAY